jgi:tRNA(Ile)-lysidine synthase
VLSPVASAPPLGLDEFAARLDRLAFFETTPLVAVAVSGGPDSLALAILADRWARRRGGEIRALCVDHRLRPESGAEISRVAGWLAARSIGCEILVWEGKKPGTRIQETARTARYRLLGEWCRAYGCLHLLTGHHREDQVETYLLRRDAHSGPDGLAGMPAIREIGGSRILRPLLDIPKARLLATLAAEAQPFLTDPSNRDPAYARARLRERAAGADPGAIVDDIRRLGRERVLRERARDALLARAAAVHPAGFAVLDPAMLWSAPADLAERALSALVFGLGGADYPPRRRAVARLLRVLAGEARGGHVLGGYRFVGWRGRTLVLREIAAAAGPARLAPGAAVLWDRRFEVALRATTPALTAPAVTVGYLGRDGVVELRRQPAANRGCGLLPALIHPILPALWDETGLAAVPSLGHRREEANMLPSLDFRPVNSMSYASFAVV